MTSEEQADARQRIEMCQLIAREIEKTNIGWTSLSYDSRVKAQQIQKQLAVVAKLLRNGTDDPGRNQPQD